MSIISKWITAPTVNDTLVGMYEEDLRRYVLKLLEYERDIKKLIYRKFDYNCLHNNYGLQ